MIVLLMFVFIKMLYPDHMECALNVLGVCRNRQALATVGLLAVGTCKKITCKALSTALIANQMPTHIEIY